MDPTRPGLRRPHLRRHQLTSPEQLFACAWRELRSEVSEWEDVGTGLAGFDGFTRYWCPQAVFDVYWIVEGDPGGDATAYLTNDMLLTGFRTEISFTVELPLLKRLAAHVGWVNSVRHVLARLQNETNSEE